MALVAIAGLALAVAIRAGRSAEFRARAEHDAEFEALSHAHADEARGPGGDGRRVARGEPMAAYHRALRLEYERAASSPWWVPEPDPPVPE